MTGSQSQTQFDFEPEQDAVTDESSSDASDPIVFPPLSRIPPDRKRKRTRAKPRAPKGAPRAIWINGTRRVNVLAVRASVGCRCYGVGKADKLNLANNATMLNELLIDREWPEARDLSASLVRMLEPMRHLATRFCPDCVLLCAACRRRFQCGGEVPTQLCDTCLANCALFTPRLLYELWDGLRPPEDAAATWALPTRAANAQLGRRDMVAVAKARGVGSGRKHAGGSVTKEKHAAHISERFAGSSASGKSASALEWRPHLHHFDERRRSPRAGRSARPTGMIAPLPTRCDFVWRAAHALVERDERSASSSGGARGERLFRLLAQMDIIHRDRFVLERSKHWYRYGIDAGGAVSLRLERGREAIAQLETLQQSLDRKSVAYGHVFARRGVVHLNAWQLRSARSKDTLGILEKRRKAEKELQQQQQQLRALREAKQAELKELKAERAWLGLEIEQEKGGRTAKILELELELKESPWQQKKKKKKKKRESIWGQVISAQNAITDRMQAKNDLRKALHALETALIVFLGNPISSAASSSPMAMAEGRKRARKRKRKHSSAAASVDTSTPASALTTTTPLPVCPEAEEYLLAFVQASEADGSKKRLTICNVMLCHVCAPAMDPSAPSVTTAPFCLELLASFWERNPNMELQRSRSADHVVRLWPSQCAAVAGTALVELYHRLLRLDPRCDGALEGLLRLGDRDDVAVAEALAGWLECCASRSGGESELHSDDVERRWVQLAERLSQSSSSSSAADSASSESLRRKCGWWKQCFFALPLPLEPLLQKRKRELYAKAKVARYMFNAKSPFAAAVAAVFGDQEDSGW